MLLAIKAQLRPRMYARLRARVHIHTHTGTCDSRGTVRYYNPRGVIVSKEPTWRRPCLENPEVLAAFSTGRFSNSAGSHDQLRSILIRSGTKELGFALRLQSIRRTSLAKGARLQNPFETESNRLQLDLH